MDRLYSKEYAMGHHGNAFTSFGAVAVVGGLVEVGRATLGSPGDTITVSSLPDKGYYVVLTSDINSGATQNTPRLGNGTADSGANYAVRFSRDGAADIAQTSQTQLGGTQSGSFPKFSVMYIANLSAKEKLTQLWEVLQNTAGVSNVVERTEHVGKWVNTSNPLDVVQAFNADAGSFNTGSQVVVLGWDPADTHTTNFFEEEGSASGSTLDITLSTARKYMWSQFLVRAGSASTTLKLRVGNGSLDSGNNYAVRQSDDGTADTTTGTTDGIQLNTNTLAANELLFVNVFMLNISAQEKLLIIHTADTNTGLGASNAPGREEIVAKHVNTSNLDDHIGIVATAGSISATSSQGTSWGGD